MTPGPAATCPLLAADLVSFGSTSDDAELQLHLRRALYTALENAFTAAGLPWNLCYREDRGDGVLIAVPPFVSPEPLLGLMICHLDAELQRHNRFHSGLARIRLRLALHHGFVHFDQYGVTGKAVIHLFRLLDAPAFKELVVASRMDLSFIISDHLYQEVVTQSTGLAGTIDYSPLAVTNKETRTTAWCRTLPPPPAVPHRLPSRTSSRSQLSAQIEFVHRGDGLRGGRDRLFHTARGGPAPDSDRLTDQPPGPADRGPRRRPRVE